MHPMGLVLVDGYSRFLPYYKSLLESSTSTTTCGRSANTSRSSSRSRATTCRRRTRRRAEVFLEALWNAYQADVTTARELPAPALQQYADEIVPLLRGGRRRYGASSRWTTGSSTSCCTRDAMRERIRDAIGEDRARRRCSADDYAGIGSRTTSRPCAPASAAGCSGEQRGGDRGVGHDPRRPAAAGRRSAAIRLAELIRHARDDEHVKALVLRVDSGGGSAFASDVILRELECFQETNRPVVVSMGSVAASGGYWISMAADEIWASPTTLTGSIGVGATIPTIPARCSTGSVCTSTASARRSSPARSTSRAPLSDNVKGLIGQIDSPDVWRVHRQGGRASRALGRGDRRASRTGRVWVGTDALDRGLVDRLGTLPRGDRVGGRARGPRERHATCSSTSSSSSDSRERLVLSS